MTEQVPERDMIADDDMVAVQNVEEDADSQFADHNDTCWDVRCPSDVMERSKAVALLAEDISKGRRIVFTMLTPVTLHAVRHLPAPFSLYLDDGTNDTLVLTSECSDALSLLMLFTILIQDPVILIVTLPIETDLMKFAADCGRESKDGATPHAGHRYVDIGMRGAKSGVAFPVFLADAMAIGDPATSAQVQALRERGKTEEGREIQVEDLQWILDGLS